VNRISRSFGRTRREAALATLGGNSIAVFIVSVQAILLIPLYLDAVGPRVSGAWLASAEILLWMQAMDLGIPNLMIQRIAAAHGRGDRRSAAEWFASGQLLLAVVGAVVAVGGVLISFSLPPLFGLADSEAEVLRGCFLLGTFASCVTIFSNGFVGLARAVQDTAFISGTLIASAIIGLVTSLALILMGWGLWAVAFGLVARAVVSVTASLGFGIFAWSREFGVPFRVDRIVVRQLIEATPATAVGGVSYALMSQSEIVLVASLTRPELGVVYALTRKAADLGRSLVDMIGFATYGGFAHLIGGPQRDQAQRVHSQILGLHLSAAVAVAAAYLAVNRSLVAEWVGPDFFGGLPLVFLMALQSVVLGHSYLINLLYRATGRVVEGSLALVIEALVRLPLFVALLLLFGLPGLPAAAILTAATSGLLIHQRSMRELSGVATPAVWSPSVVMLLRLGFLAIGGVLAVTVFAPSWLYVVVVGGTIAVVGALMLIVIDPLLRDEFLSWAGRPSPVRRSSPDDL
jgi:O-antigen/teichoic acid export membrane protein